MDDNAYWVKPEERKSDQHRQIRGKQGPCHPNKGLSSGWDMGVRNKQAPNENVNIVNSNFSSKFFVFNFLLREVIGDIRIKGRKKKSVYNVNKPFFINKILIYM